MIGSLGLLFIAYLQFSEARKERIAASEALESARLVEQMLDETRKNITVSESTIMNRVAALNGYIDLTSALIRFNAQYDKLLVFDNDLANEEAQVNRRPDPFIIDIEPLFSDDGFIEMKTPKLDSQLAMFFDIDLLLALPTETFASRSVNPPVFIHAEQLPVEIDYWRDADLLFSFERNSQRGIVLLSGWRFRATISNIIQILNNEKRAIEREIQELVGKI